MTTPSEDIENYDPSYEVLFSAGWTDWEESGYIYILHKEGKYYSIKGGYCPYSPYSKPDFTKHLEEITEAAALALMEEWREMEDDQVWTEADIEALRRMQEIDPTAGKPKREFRGIPEVETDAEKE